MTTPKHVIVVHDGEKACGLLSCITVDKSFKFARLIMKTEFDGSQFGDWKDKAKNLPNRSQKPSEWLSESDYVIKIVSYYSFGNICLHATFVYMLHLST